MWRFARRGPTRCNRHVIQHYQSILGAGIATRAAFLIVDKAHLWPLITKVWTTLTPGLFSPSPCCAPDTLAKVALVRLNRRFASNGRAGACLLGTREVR